jgi:hypothetical protein
MVMTKSSSLTQVSRLIAAVNEEKPNTVRQRLKEWYQSGKAKKGEKRSTLEVSSCFAPLLMWVISLLPIDLVVCQDVIDGYNLFNLIRASSVVNRQSTGAEFSFLRFSQAATSSVKISLSSIRRSRHCRLKTLNSISAIFNQLPCLGV